MSIYPPLSLGAKFSGAGIMNPYAVSEISRSDQWNQGGGFAIKKFSKTCIENKILGTSGDEERIMSKLYKRTLRVSLSAGPSGRCHVMDMINLSGGPVAFLQQGRPV
ncbi:hypothetical protein [Paracoccus sp. (in: a-proteobacteria)]|uniref:hypothetical protein n=1 Tax=Paracoccus sp. TaxID=267 RepID=UPI002B0026B2|nr:hypothetical protein [Paracoccus sp. (in: a-proteobacteria)]